jgi:hypothetical protein
MIADELGFVFVCSIQMLVDKYNISLKIESFSFGKEYQLDKESDDDILS